MNVYGGCQDGWLRLWLLFCCCCEGALSRQQGLLQSTWLARQLHKYRAIQTGLICTTLQSQSETQTASIESRDSRETQQPPFAKWQKITELAFTESTKATSKRATLHTDGRCQCVVGTGCVARFLIPASFQAHLGAATNEGM
jgi:hypothetical protein